jgi:hypothetical protein
MAEKRAGGSSGRVGGSTGLKMGMARHPRPVAGARDREDAAAKAAERDMAGLGSDRGAKPLSAFKRRQR